VFTGRTHTLSKPSRSTACECSHRVCRSVISTGASRPTPWNWWRQAAHAVCGTSDQPNRQLGKISQLFDCTCLLPSRVVLPGSSGCDTKYSRPAVAAQHHAGATPSNTPSGFCQVTNARSRRPGLLYTGQSIGCIRQEGHPQDSIATALLAAMQPISPPSSAAEANLRVSTSQACNCV
jgi:hypothetical protein